MKARALLELSRVHLDCQEYEPALERAAQSLAINQEMDNPWGQVYVLEHQGNIYAAQSAQQAARQTWEEALRIAGEFARHPLQEKLYAHLYPGRRSS
jgi:predicted negative regulator of RcsB-dependent stress response